MQTNKRRKTLNQTILDDLDTWVGFDCESLYKGQFRTDLAERALTHLLTRYTCIGTGLYRIAFQVGDHVFKFPRDESGEYCNDGEGSVQGTIFARGKWIEWRGFVCVMQEKLTMPTNNQFAHIRRRPRLDWIGSIDGGQVGYDKQGRIKAYDFVHP